MIYNEDIREAISILKSGGIILYPTDTIWGIGCDPSNQNAVEKIFKLKTRDNNQSLIILVNSIEMLERYVSYVPEIAFELISVSTTPLTIVYEKGKNLAPGVCADDGSVGIRVCMDEFCNELISRLRKPIVSTSANISGKQSPRSFSDIEKSIIASVDFVVKYRQEERKTGIASSIIKINQDNTIKILRK